MKPAVRPSLVSSSIGVRRLRFPPEVIIVAVPWYLRYSLSNRDVEELLAERSIDVDHVTVYRWVQRFTPLLVDAARFARHTPGDRWFVDETYVKVNGVWRYVYRAVDQHGQVIDVLLSTRREAKAAGRFFTRATPGPHGAVAALDESVTPGRRHRSAATAVERRANGCLNGARRLSCTARIDGSVPTARR